MVILVTCQKLLLDSPELLEFVIFGIVWLDPARLVYGEIFVGTFCAVFVLEAVLDYLIL